MRIVIVAVNASAMFGGEAFLPLNYFRLLRGRKADVHLVVHQRNAKELNARFPGEADRLHFVQDGPVERLLFRASRLLPGRVAEVTTVFVNHLLIQLRQRRIVRELVRDRPSSVVHEPIPVSPKFPSLMFDTGAAVVIGPLNGGLEYPPAFRSQESYVARFARASSRRSANIFNYLIPGKRRAEVLLVANRRSLGALPRRLQGRVIEFVDNGVDFSLWRCNSKSKAPPEGVRFIFVGRLIELKAVDIILEAIDRIRCAELVSLEIIGDGPMLETWKDMVRRMKLDLIVKFSGWLSQPDCAQRLQQADVFVMPSIFECGGAVVLEAMAMKLPIIATAWGGPSDYLDVACAKLIRPDSREALIDGFAAAMMQLAQCPGLRKSMGQAGHERALQKYDWDKKIDEILKIYALAARSHRSMKLRSAKAMQEN